MALTYRTVTGTYVDGSGQPLMGHVVFTPSSPLTDAAGHLIIGSNPVTVTLDGTSGTFSRRLLCTDSADTLPTGWVWYVGVQVQGAEQQFAVLLPTGDGTPVDLTSLAPGVAAPPAGGTYVTSFNGASGAVTGFGSSTAVAVTGTPAAGKVLTATGAATADWETPSGGGGALLAVNNLSDLASAATSRTNLGLSAAATAALPLAVASGGTGQTTAPGARTALGLGTAATAAIDTTATDIQPLGVRSAGATGSVADAGHVHPTTGTVSSVTAADTSVTVGGSASAPTIATASLDVIAADHPPVASWSNGSNKITSLANGTAATDAAAFGQIPATTIVAAATGTYATDVANIGAAITAAGTNGTVYFPYGTYNADGLAPLSGQTWYGYATIQRPSTSTASIVTATGLTGFTMRDLVIDGNRAGGSTATSNAAVYLINSTWCRIQGITVQNTPSTNAGVILRGAVRCVVADCQLSNVGYGVLIGLNHGDAYNCYGNLIKGVVIDTTDADAIFLTENLGSTGSVSVVGSVIGNVVTGCTVRNFGDCGIEVGSGTVNTEVSGCAFVGISNARGNNGILFRDAANSSATGCTVSNLTKAGSTGVYCVNLNGTNKRISINSIDIQNVGYGVIAVGGTSPSVIGTAATDIAINGGIIDTTSADGVQFANVSGFSVNGTTVRNAGNQGISVGKVSTTSATDGTITGARVFNSGQGGANYSGVIVFQSSADITITGCRIGDNQGTKTQAYGVRLFDTTVSSVTISNCDLTNGGTVSNFSSAPAMGSGIQVLNCIGVSPSALPNVITQPGAGAEPSDHGLTAWSYDSGLASQSSTTVSGGTLYLVAVYPRQAFNSTTAYFSIATAGVTPTSGDNWIGLYNTSGTLLASKGIDANVTGLGLQTITWASPTGVQPAGQYWIGFYFNAATEPTLYRAPTPSDNATQNVGLTTTNYRMCQQAGGFTTALPSPLTVSSNSIAGSPRLWWVALK